MKKYRDSEKIYDHWKDKYEEAYEYTLPQRESFHEETVGERRTDKIFDETAVVGIQEFARDYKLVLFLHMEDGQTLKLDQKYQINKNQLLMNN